MFDGKFLGYLAIGQDIIFRGASGADTTVCHIPEDIDAHIVARALNDSANSVLCIAREISQFKF